MRDPGLLTYRAVAADSEHDKRALPARRTAKPSDRFDVAGTPGLVKPGLEGAIEPQSGEPPFAGNGLDPVVLELVGAIRAEHDVDRAVGVVFESVFDRIPARIRLIGLQLAWRLN